MERGGPGGLVCDLLALLCVACMSGFGLGIRRGGGGGGSSRPSIIAGPVDPLRRRRLALVDPRWGPVSSNRPKVRGTPPSPSETPSNKAGMVTGGGWRVGVPWCVRPSCAVSSATRFGGGGLHQTDRKLASGPLNDSRGWESAEVVGGDQDTQQRSEARCPQGSES